MKIPCEDTVTQFLKFGVVGVGNTLLSLAVYYLFIWINPRLYQAGNAVGWVVSVANAFYWNNKYVFYGGAQNKKVLLRQISPTPVKAVPAETTWPSTPPPLRQGP